MSLEQQRTIEAQQRQIHKLNKELRIEQLEKERDELKAAVSMAIDAFKKYEMDVDTYPTVDHVRMMDQLNAVLAKHDAEVIDNLKFPTMFRKMWSGGEVQAWLKEEANLIRQKAQEV